MAELAGVESDDLKAWLDEHGAEYHDIVVAPFARLIQAAHAATSEVNPAIPPAVQNKRLGKPPKSYLRSWIHPGQDGYQHVKLFLELTSARLAFGLTSWVSPVEERAALAAGVKAMAPQVWEALKNLPLQPVFQPNSDYGPGMGHTWDMEGPEDLRLWAKGSSPNASVQLCAADSQDQEILFGHDLEQTISSTMQALELLARHAWDAMPQRTAKCPAPLVPGREGMRILHELAGINNTDAPRWKELNKKRIETELRAPFKHLMETVGEQYLWPLDSALSRKVEMPNITLKDPTQWRPHYTPIDPTQWSAFSRGNPRRDLQLFVRVGPKFMECGFWPGQGSPEQQQALAQVVDRNREPLWDSISELVKRERLTFTTVNGNATVTSPNELAAWAQQEHPRVACDFAPNDAAVGTDQLVKGVGEVLVALHPIAARTWEKAPAQEKQSSKMAPPPTVKRGEALRLSYPSSLHADYEYMNDEEMEGRSRLDAAFRLSLGAMLHLVSLAFSDYRSKIEARDDIEQQVVRGQNGNVTDGRYVDLLRASLKAVPEPLLPVSKIALPDAARLNMLTTAIKNNLTVDLKSAVEDAKRQQPGKTTLVDAIGWLVRYRNRVIHQRDWPTKNRDYYELLNPVLFDAIHDIFEATPLVDALDKHPIAKLNVVQAEDDDTYLHIFMFKGKKVEITSHDLVTKRWSEPQWNAKKGAYFILAPAGDTFEVEGLFHDLTETWPVPMAVPSKADGTAP